MPIDVHPFPGARYREFAAAGEIPFGLEASPDYYAEWEQSLDLERLIAATDGDTIVGTAAAYTFELTVPGAVLPAAGVTMVGVLPTHRRRGILTQMMRLQLDDVRGRGEPLAVLTASEGAIYPRFGYGVATLTGRFDVPSTATAMRDVPPPEGSVRLLGHDEALRELPPVYDAVRRVRPGFFTRSPAWWEYEVLADGPHRREGHGAQFVAGYEVDGRLEGYARYRMKWEPAENVPGFTSEVRELVAATDRGRRDLWRYLFSIDLVRRTRARSLPPDDPVFLMLAEPRQLGFTLGDGLYLRLVDVAAALRTRGYASQGTLVLELSDGFCPWNAGRWRLRVSSDQPAWGPGGVQVGATASVDPTERPADLALDASALGSAYLGGFSFRSLAAAGRVTELREGALRQADEMFAVPVPPWLPMGF